MNEKFYYFHNKKELYLYVYNYSVEVMKEQVVDTKFREIADFFELLEYASREKCRVLAKNPYIMDFAMHFIQKKMNTTEEGLLYQMYFGNIDRYKFKEDVDPHFIFKMLRWMADGYMHNIQMLGKEIVVEELMEEYDKEACI